MLQDENQDYPFEVYHSFPTPLPLSIIVPHIFNALKALKHQYDLVFTQFHLYHLASYTALLSKTLGKPWVVKVHDMIFDPALPMPLPMPVSEKGFINSCYQLFVRASYGLFLKEVGKKADKILVSTTELQNLLQAYGHSPDKVVVSPNGVDTKLFSPPASKGNCSDKKTLLYIGNLIPQYGLLNLVKAFSLLNQEKQLSLTFIGEGPERLKLIELAKKLDLEQKVIFHRHIPHKLIPQFIRESYTGIGPLRVSRINYYTIPTKIVEYFACERPVVSSPVSEDILIDKSAGFVLKDVSPRNIAERLSFMIEHEKLTHDMGKKGRQLVVERFDWEKIIDRIDDEIRTLEP
jgi:glycosyltransferase involved in cell wall biosynthesis